MATSAGALAWSNLVVPRLPRRAGVRTAAGTALALGLTALSRAGGLSWAELGLAPRSVPTGLVGGAGALAAVGTAYRIAWSVPAARRALADAAPEDPQGPLWRTLLLHIPVGTVLVEELAFRGVLDALARRAMPDGSAAAWQVGTFALWHVENARHGVRTGADPTGAVAQALAVTSVGGVLFTWLARRTGSLLAPAGLHLASNAFGLVAATRARHNPGGLGRNPLPSENAYP